MANAKNLSNDRKNSWLSGTILININNQRDIQEFQINTSDNVLEKVYEVEAIRYIENNKEKWTEESDVFKNTYNKERKFNKDKLIEKLKGFDLLNFEKLEYLSKEDDCKPDSFLSMNEALKKIKDKKIEQKIAKYKKEREQKSAKAKKEYPEYPNYWKSWAPKPITFEFVKPNKQFSYVTYNDGGYSKGIVLDLNTKQVYFPYCGFGGFEHSEWSKNGNYIAYSMEWSSHSKYDLIIKDIINHKTYSTIIIGERIDDITWAPDSNKIAVLFKTYRSGYWPFELLGSIFGHPTPYYSFYLKVFNVEGKELFSTEVIEDVKYGEGKLVWTTGVCDYKDIQ